MSHSWEVPDGVLGSFLIEDDPLKKEWLNQDILDLKNDFTYILLNRYLDDIIFLGLSTSLKEALFKRNLEATNLGRWSNGSWTEFTIGDLLTNFRRPIFFREVVGPGTCTVAIDGSGGIRLLISLFLVQNKGFSRLALGASRDSRSTERQFPFSAFFAIKLGFMWILLGLTGAWINLGLICTFLNRGFM